jgi:hypothetical protein
MSRSIRSLKLATRSPVAATLIPGPDAVGQPQQRAGQKDEDSGEAAHGLWARCHKRLNRRGAQPGQRTSLAILGSAGSSRIALPWRPEELPTTWFAALVLDRLHFLASLSKEHVEATFCAVC